MEKLCVFCGSSKGINNAYVAAAKRLGKLMAEQKIELIYGGGSIGIMGELANAVLENGGRVTGVIPKFLYDKEVGHDDITKLIIVETMHERKMTMASLSEGFLALPGGIGTLEELFEIYTWNQLSLVKHPVALLNVEGYFDELIRFMEKMEKEGFIRSHTQNILIKCNDVEQVLHRMRDHKSGRDMDLSIT